MAFPVLLDTCVLFPMYLRDTLLRLAVAEIYQPLWSADILDELRTVLVREQVMASDGAERIVGLMRRYFPEAEVTGYDSLIPSMPCDPGDRHVLAAAVQGGGYRREPTTIDGLMVALARSGAPGFADEIRRRLA